MLLTRVQSFKSNGSLNISICSKIWSLFFQFSLMETPNIVHYFPHSHAWRRHAFLAMNGRKLAWAKTSQVTLWLKFPNCVQKL